MQNEEIFKTSRLHYLLKKLLTARHWNTFDTVKFISHGL